MLSAYLAATLAIVSQTSVVPYPHPLITEVLYAVPTANGDANGDGTRQVAGDEFIELVNPHDKPIRLAGYTLTDKNPADRGQFRFSFPAVTLQPGQVAVVFNGCESTWVGAVGDSSKPPHAGNKDFHNAVIFTARADNTRVSFANTGDFVLLTAPDGKPVHRIAWGEVADLPPLPPGTPDERAPANVEGSVQRADAGARLTPHPPVAGRRFSPGHWGAGPLSAGEADAPPDAKPDTQQVEATPAVVQTLLATPESPTAALPDFPHPMIREVLYDVPAWADASMDGAPDRTGDEFIEVWNPHVEAIQLGGYRIEVRDKPGQGRLDFTFPKVELPAGGTVVVFNGFRQKLGAPVGDSARAPASGSDLFAGALLFTMRNSDARAALDDHDDWVVLRSPANAAVHAVAWGRPTPPPPDAGIVSRAAATLPGSVGRSDADGTFLSHAEMHGVPFSPGAAER